MAGPDRKNALLAQNVLTGIDFVAVHDTQVVLDVFFVCDPTTLATPLTDLTVDQIAIVGEDDPRVPIASIAWPGPVDGREVLRITTARPGGYGPYWLTIDDPRLDPFFRRIQIDFKAACPSKLDCAVEPHQCPPADRDDIVVDGSARDFWSLRRALLDFAALRNPRWKDRLEADIGVTLVELMAALGDELAYYQDRVARETHWETANERRSLRRHARLVDYELHDGLGATGWLAVEVDPAFAGFQLVPAGTKVWARSDGARPIGFEIGNGLADVIAGRTFRVAAIRNQIAAHIWDGDEPDAHAAHRPLPTMCLPAGATELYIQGHHAANFQVGERVVLVTTPPATEKDAPLRRWLVTLTAIDDDHDPLGAVLGTGADVTRLRWAEPTPYELDLAWTSVLGNVLPVTAGITHTQIFSIGPSLQPVPAAVERTGRDGSILFLFTLPDRDGDGVVRLGSDPHEARPEVDLVQTTPPLWDDGLHWELRRSFLHGSGPRDRHYILEDGTWDRVVGYQRLGGEVVHRDYLAGIGSTIRFGDGELGQVPDRGHAAAGQERFFKVRYRLGNGARGNVAAEAIRFADPNGELGFGAVGLPFIARVWNPLPVSGGVDPETADEVRRDAPEAFRAITHRAVRPEDYDDVAARLPWVQRAGTTFRWTGSWLTAFTAADPKQTAELPLDRRLVLARHLDRFRQAGREVHVLEPRYADLELRIVFCVESTSYPSEVVVAVRRAVAAFFAPDHFTFGTPLDRSELEAAVQRVPGVRGVKEIWIARRGHFAERPFVEAHYRPGNDEVIRVENDRRHPDRGSVTLVPEGGA